MIEFDMNLITKGSGVNGESRRRSHGSRERNKKKKKDVLACLAVYL
jgi:hypothetical protein